MARNSKGRRNMAPSASEEDRRHAAEVREKRAHPFAEALDDRRGRGGAGTPGGSEDRVDGGPEARSGMRAGCWLGVWVSSAIGYQEYRRAAGAASISTVRAPEPWPERLQFVSESV